MLKSLFSKLSYAALIVASSATANPSYETIEDLSPLVIKTASLEGRETAKIRLANGITAYIVSDPGADQSAAALAVGVGSWQDAEEYPGMAHFLEHMLFMGTAAYPGESEYMQYIGDNGGMRNAYTAPDRTVYMFSVNNNAFDGALDRLAHFFIDPLFSPNAISRELLAVDQEHSKNIEHDGWRQWMVLKETGNQNHPNAKFSTGTAETLGGIPQEAMKEWYATHYTPEKMHLVVFSPLPIDQLVELAVKDFSPVPQRIAREYTIPDQFTSDRQRGHFTYIKPIKDLKTLTLTWEVPKELTSNRAVQPSELVAYVLNSGAKNSLLGTLKREHLAQSIKAFEEPASVDQALFQIEIQLTEKGLEHIDEVVTYTFEALARIKSTGIPRYIYEEVRQIGTVQFEFQSRTKAFEFVREYAHNMVDEDITTFPAKSTIPVQYNPAVNGDFLQLLTPRDCLYYVTANPAKLKVKLDKKEKWMGAEYKIVAVPEEKLKKWSRVRINNSIGLPPPNPFVPKNLDLVHTVVSKKKEAPVQIQSDDHAKIYFASDERYLVPEVAYLFRYKAPQLNGSPKAKALQDLFALAANDKLFPTTSAAQTAGFSVAISSHELCLGVHIKGYSDKANELTNAVFGQLKKVRPSKEEFGIYFDQLKAKYENASKELPVVQSLMLMSSVITSDTPTSEQKLVALESISYKEFVTFAKSLMNQGYFEGLLYGNLTEEKAKHQWASLQARLRTDPYPIALHHRKKFLELPKGQGPFMVVQPTPCLGNSAILMVEEGPFSFEKRSAQQVLGHVLKDDFFDTLRTKQQVGYIALAREQEIERQLIQVFAVQSSTHKPQELIARFELFLEDFLKQYETKLSEARFETIRTMGIEKLENPPENLFLMGQRLFLLGFEYEGDFNWMDKRIDALKEITYGETRAAAHDFFSRGNRQRLAILVEGACQAGREFKYEEVTTEELKSHGTFVAWK